MTEAKVSVEAIDVEKIVPYEKNAKIHSKEQIEKLAASIREFGWDQPIVVDENLVIIKGHGRLLAAKALGMKKAPVIVRKDLSPSQVRAARLADNRLASTEYDTRALNDELASLFAEEIDLEALGFTDRETAFLLNDPGTFDDAAFISDVSAATSEAKAATDETIAEIDGSMISLTKAMGVKEVPLTQAPAFTEFMALIEGETKQKGGDALVKFVSDVVKASKTK